LSFKSSGAQAQLEPEEFTYPQAPTAKVSDANEAEKTKHLWTARAAGQEAPDPEESAKKEQLIWGRGAEAGRVQARAEFEQKLSKVHEEIGKALRQFAAERDSYFHAVEEQLVRLSLAMARKILHREAQVDPLLLAGVFRVALEKIGANTNIRLRTNPTDIKVWREYFAQDHENCPSPELVGDSSLEPSRCILETELGTTEIGLETQLKEIELGFMDLLAQRPGQR
jgi:flagellar assembly protein FliH